MRTRGGLISTATTTDQFPITDKRYFRNWFQAFAQTPLESAGHIACQGTLYFKLNETDISM